jgi:AraC family transcriptional regulator of adaptative response/methylated-DNA-[protein]-cysteine methyltransferase
MQLMSSRKQKWESVLARDAKADGEFVYAVKSTGIFCRPSCPSRRPRRELVEFFESPREAERAGYRACRRCTPLQQSSQLKKVEAACRFMDENLETAVTLTGIAAQVGMSPFHFQRVFKKVLGLSPREYQQSRRAEQFRSALRSEQRITDAIYEAGYSSSSRAYEHSAENLGMTPSAFRRKGEGVPIRFTVVNTGLGKLLVATTPRGICSVKFGDTEAALVTELKNEFGAATLNRDDEGLRTEAEELRQLVAAHKIPSGLAIDIRGTAFQRMVWKALRQIPRGETRSYAEVAASIGKPKSVRAVANACAANPVALLVPCHRVVQKSGSLAGYRWGVERKAALLRGEQAAGQDRRGRTAGGLRP